VILDNYDPAMTDAMAADAASLLDRLGRHWYFADLVDR
jgi:hypothetical protein